MTALYDLWIPAAAGKEKGVWLHVQKKRRCPVLSSSFLTKVRTQGGQGGGIG